MRKRFWQDTGQIAGFYKERAQIAMMYTFRCACGHLKTVIFGRGPCKECGTNAINRIEE